MEVPAPDVAVPRALDEEYADALGAGARIRLGRDQREIRVYAPGNIDLVPVDDVVVAVANRSRLDRLQVASAVRLRHGDRENDLARANLRQVAPPLLFRPEIEDVKRRKARFESHAGARAGGAAAEFLGDDELVYEVAARPAVFLRHPRRNQANFPGAAPEAARDDAVPLPGFDVRREFVRQETPKRLSKRLVLRPVNG